MGNKYDVIIIGAGIGGLVCANYLIQEGLRVLVVEQQSKPGGYCSSFERGGYRFDVGLHYLGGLKQGVLGKILKELGLEDKMEFSQLDPTDKIIVSGRTLYIRADSQETIEELRKNFPEERENIKNFFKFLMQEKFLDVYRKAKKKSFKELLDSFFDDERLKTALGILMANVGSSPAQVFAPTALIFYREFILDPGYYPQGGMQKFSDILLAQFRNYGGEFLSSCRVRKILTSPAGRVQGILTQDNFIGAEYIVGNCDATQIFEKLLDRDTTEKRIVKKLRPSSSIFMVYLGINTPIEKLVREVCNLWYVNTFALDNLFTNLKEVILSEEKAPFGLIFFPSAHFAGGKKHTIQISINAPYLGEKFWQTHRELMVEKMIGLAEQFIPSLEEHIEMRFSATPITFERYTANREGALYGWESSLSQARRGLLPQRTSLENLFLAGHWCISGVGGEGGVSGVANLGRNAARLVLNSLGKNWRRRLFLLDREN